MDNRRVLGSYYTPLEVVRFMFDLVGPVGGSDIIDPACGDGAFLSEALLRGARTVVGAELDQTVAQTAAKANPRARILCQSGLEEINGSYDLTIGNPPFSTGYNRIRDPEILRRFTFIKTGKSQVIEVLFLERFIQLAKDGGRVCVILPAGIFANSRLGYIRETLTRCFTICAVIGLPRDTFRNAGTTAKTAILFLKKTPPPPGHKTLLVEISECSKEQFDWCLKKANGPA